MAVIVTDSFFFPVTDYSGKYMANFQNSTNLITTLYI